MARPNERWRPFGPLKGENNRQNPLALGSLGEGWAVRTRNVVLRPEDSVVTKRKGSVERADTPSGTYMLARHRPPNSSEADAELWAFTAGAPPSYPQGIFRAIGGGPFVAVPFPADVVRPLRALTFNGKLFLAGLTFSNRIYCWDGTQIRPVGINPGTVAPTASNGTNTGLPSVLRHYKVNWMRTDPVTGKITARSELTPALAFQNAAGFTVTVTRPPAVPDAATHWRVWGSSDGGNTYLRLTDTPIPVATTTFTDTLNPTTYTGMAAPEVGAFLPPPAAIRIITDGNRLLFAASPPGMVTAAPGENVPKQNRVWYTPVLGSTDEGDDERVPVTASQKNFIDLGENTLDGAINELGGPINGLIYVGMQRRLWRLIPTGELVTPYLSYLVSDRYGATRASNMCGLRMMNGEDHHGEPALYFISEAGLYRVTSRVEHVSFDVTDRLVAPIWWREWQFLLSFPDQRQLWVCSGQGDEGALQPRIYVFHWEQGYPDENGDIRGGWTTWDVPIDPERGFLYASGCLHNRTPGSGDADKVEQIPYLVQGASPLLDLKIQVFDQPFAKDAEKFYRASVRFAPWMARAATTKFRVGNPVVIATAVPAAHLEVQATRDFGTETRRGLLSLEPMPWEGDPTHVVRVPESLFQGDVTCVEFEIGDPAPPVTVTDKLWRIDWFTAPVSEQE